NLPFIEIINGLLSLNLNLNDMRSKILSETHEYIKDVLDNRVLGSTEIFELKKLKNSPFIKYAKDILNIRKEEFESTNIAKYYEDNEIKYEVTEISKTYYGKKFLRILQCRHLILNPDEFKKFYNYSLKLNLRLKIIDNSSLQ
ncbi:MAG: hypothetical protein ACW972_09040, partial [Promethearchaeota archaeon]